MEETPVQIRVLTDGRPSGRLSSLMEINDA